MKIRWFGCWTREAVPGHKTDGCSIECRILKSCVVERRMVDVVGVVAIVFFYLVILVVGIWAGRKSKDAGANGGDKTDDVMLAGRNIGVLVGIFTMTGNTSPIQTQAPTHIVQLSSHRFFKKFCNFCTKRMERCSGTKIVTVVIFSDMGWRGVHQRNGRGPLQRGSLGLSGAIWLLSVACTRRTAVCWENAWERICDDARSIPNQVRPKGWRTSLLTGPLGRSLLVCRYFGSARYVHFSPWFSHVSFSIASSYHTWAAKFGWGGGFLGTK